MLHRGDAAWLLRQVAGAHALISDPPFGQTDAAWDGQPFDAAAARELVAAATRPTAVLALFAIQPFATDVIVAWRRWFRYDLIWEKNRATGFLNANRQPLRRHELILIFSRETGCYQPQLSPGKPYRTKGDTVGCQLYRARKRVAHVNHGMRHPTSVLPFAIPMRERIHPTQKPLGLVEWLVRSYTRPGELVLDPFAGSATTAEACLRTGRRFVGCELDREIFAAAAARLAAAEQEPASVAREAVG